VLHIYVAEISLAEYVAIAPVPISFHKRISLNGAQMADISHTDVPAEISSKFPYGISEVGTSDFMVKRKRQRLDLTCGEGSSSEFNHQKRGKSPQPDSEILFKAICILHILLYFFTFV